jgi:hypothetical protein
MGKAKLILGLAVLALAVIACWQIGSCELADFELHEDLRDLAAQGGARIGLAPPVRTRISVAPSSARPRGMRFSLNLGR